MSDTAGKAKQQRNEILIARTAHSAGSANNSLGKSAGILSMPKKSAPHFQRSAFVSRRGCASQLQ